MRLPVSDYRFLLRRVECALLGRDVREVNEPIRAALQSLIAGVVLAILLLAGCALLAVVRPQPVTVNAPIVMSRQSGALYVRIGETLHPVLNLASARLIARTSADPQPVADSDLRRRSRGALLGIPGAPPSVGLPLGADEVGWTVCDSDDDSVRGTTVIIGGAAEPSSTRLSSEQSVLVSVPGGSTYLLYDGRRAVVNMDEPAVVRALMLDGQVPSAVSPTLLNAVPEAPPIAAPRIPDAGSRGPATLPGFPVGSVLRVARADGDEYYVVLRRGLQRVGRVTADLLRFTDSRGARTAVPIAPDVVHATPMVTDLPVDSFPDRAPTPRNSGPTTLCASWRHGASGAETSFSAGGLPIPAGHRPVQLSQADAQGPAVDAVYLPPGRSAYVRATGLSGDNPQAATRYLITDTGVRFAIHDDEAAHDLGMPDAAIPAPWPVLAKLPAGPELSRAKASVVRDVVAGSP